jgi:thioredoxin 1
MSSEQMPKAIHDPAEFEEVVLHANELVLVDFWATWCGPCRTLAPALDELARELAGRARVVKVDVDEHPELAREYEIASIPCLVIFRNGKEARRMVGLTPKGRIADALGQVASAA